MADHDDDASREYAEKLARIIAPVITEAMREPPRIAELDVKAAATIDGDQIRIAVVVTNVGNAEARYVQLAAVGHGTVEPARPDLSGESVYSHPVPCGCAFIDAGWRPAIHHDRQALTLAAGQRAERAVWFRPPAARDGEHRWRGAIGVRDRTDLPAHNAEPYIWRQVDLALSYVNGSWVLTRGDVIDASSVACSFGPLDAD